MFIDTKLELIVLVCLLFTYGEKLLRMLFMNDSYKINIVEND